MSHITLKLTADQIDVVLSALGDQPFVKVHELINQIRAQAVPQWEDMQKALAPDENKKEE